MARKRPGSVTGILRAGLTRIQNGWAQGKQFAYRNGVEVGEAADENANQDPLKATNFCAIGAVTIESFRGIGMGKINVARARLDEATQILTRGSYGDVVEYNDEENRRKEQIVAVYRKAIELQTHRPA